MRSAEAEIHAYVVEKLFAVAKDIEYPIHTGLSLNALFETFREVNVELMHEDQQVLFMRRCGHPVNIVEEWRSYEELLVGWGSHPVGSIKSLDDSVYSICHELWKEYDERKIMEKKLSAVLEQRLSQACAQYQENFFVSRKDGKNPLLSPPRLLQDIIGQECVVELYNKLIIQGLSEKLDNKKFHPAAEGLLAKVAAAMIVHLANQKGYRFVDDTGHYEKILKWGWKKTLVHASVLWPVR